ncbi:MAG TPA: sulfatase-like hydrolase/transferase [Candidatus Angelobacter sp.]|nr:sulfatase-like hydrolase/transferase [Candidatus Angelobacter sp.]
MNNYILIVFDSCRYDSFAEAETKTLSRMGTIEQRFSYASWTAPSHFNLLMGLMPHDSPRHTVASDSYKHEFTKYAMRLGAKDLDFKTMLPSLYLPVFLKEKLHYSTHAMVSLPVLNPKTVLNRGFDTYTLMPKHNDMRAMLKRMQFEEDRPFFYLLNVGETHYPYALPHEDPCDWPKIHGVHGVYKHMGDSAADSGPAETKQSFPSEQALKDMRERQVAAVRYLDQVMEELLDLVPKNTFVTVTGDHGELFGEDGYFGHGPIMHPKVMEVPFVEAQIR